MAGIRLVQIEGLPRICGISIAFMWIPWPWDSPQVLGKIRF